MSKKYNGWFGENRRHSIAAKKCKYKTNSNQHLDWVKPDATNRVEMIVPSTRNTYKNGQKKTEKISPTEMNNRVKETRLHMSNNFGGYTSVKDVGGWHDTDNKKLIEENGVIVYSAAKKKDLYAHDKDFLNYAKQKQKKWGQDTIGVSLNNKYTWVDQNSKIKSRK